MLDGGSIAAIITGIIALVSAVAAAWMSGWNERRQSGKKNMRIISEHAMPLLISAWDLHNYFYDVLDARNYRLVSSTCRPIESNSS